MVPEYSGELIRIKFYSHSYLFPLVFMNPPFGGFHSLWDNNENFIKNVSSTFAVNYQNALYLITMYGNVSIIQNDVKILLESGFLYLKVKKKK